MLILHDFDLSAECYAVRLLAALIGVRLELVRVDVYPGRANEDDSFLALNPLGMVPVLEHAPAGDEHALRDSLLCDWPLRDWPLRDWQAILAHLALRHDATGQWWPGEDTPALVAWLGMARDLGASAGLARLHDGMGVAADIAKCRETAQGLLREIERQLWFGERGGQLWLLPGKAPSVADIAIFVHAVLCEEGGIERHDYPALRRWIDRIRHLPGFVPMSGVFAPSGRSVAA